MKRLFQKHYIYRLIVTWITLVSCVPATSVSGTSRGDIPLQQAPIASLAVSTQTSKATEPIASAPGDYQVYLPTVAVEGLHFDSISSNVETIPVYDKIELTFSLNNSLASRPDFPYDPSPPPGLPGRTGVTVDALFLPPGQVDWNKAQVQPGFRYQPFQRIISDDAEGLYPIGELTWMARFSPQIIGDWKFKLRAQRFINLLIGGSSLSELG